MEHKNKKFTSNANLRKHDFLREEKLKTPEKNPSNFLPITAMHFINFMCHCILNYKSAMYLTE